jgi:hypothetical protein
MVQNGSEWFRMVQNGSEWFRMVQSGSERNVIEQNGTKQKRSKTNFILANQPNLTIHNQT